MKMILVIFVAAAISMSAYAADITLKDGRVLKEATVASQTPRKVTIKHSIGLSSVAKELLPPELLARYPVDEDAARAAEEKAIIAREAALVSRKAESERVARVLAQREEAAAKSASNQAKEAARNDAQNAAIKMQAASLAERYFEKDYGRSASGTRSARVTISTIRPVDGVEGRWFVTGRAVIRTHQEQSYLSTMSGYSPPDRNREDASSAWREQYNQTTYDNIDHQKSSNARHRRHRDSEVRHNPPATQSAPSTPHVETPRGSDIKLPDLAKLPDLPQDRVRQSQSSTRDNNTKNPADTKRASGSNKTKRQFEKRHPEYSSWPAYSYDSYDGLTETRDFEGTYSTENATPTIDVTLR